MGKKGGKVRRKAHRGAKLGLSSKSKSSQKVVQKLVKPVSKITSVTPSTDARALQRVLQSENVNPKALGPFRDRHRILVVGDGDFSFSYALALHLGGKNVVATCFDTEYSVVEKYPSSARSNMNGIRATGAPIHCGVDATALEKCTALCPFVQSFDRIVFNFPHVGGATESDIVANQSLLTKFFKSAGAFLNPGTGRIYVSLRHTPFYDSWDIKDQAQKAGLESCTNNTIPFDSSAFPGYVAQRTNPAARDAPSCDNASYFIFQLSPSFTTSKAIKRRIMRGSTVPHKPDVVVKKKKAGYACQACSVKFTEERKYNGHINSAKHAKKVKLLKKK